MCNKHTNKYTNKIISGNGIRLMKSVDMIKNIPVSDGQCNCYAGSTESFDKTSVQRLKGKDEG